MLQLCRCEDEAIKIGDNITIYVTRIRGHEVRLSIDAPKEVPITRDDAKLRCPKLASLSAESDAS